MRFDYVIEAVNLVDQRLEQTICRQLIDALNGLGHGNCILRDIQLFLAGEVTDAMHEELNVLLERRTGWEWRFIAALQIEQNQSTARRDGVAQQAHLRAAKCIHHHIHTTAIGQFADAADQILLLGEDDVICAQLLEKVAVLSKGCRRNDRGAQSFAHLHDVRAPAAACGRYQHGFAGLQTRQFNETEPADHRW